MDRIAFRRFIATISVVAAAGLMACSSIDIQFTSKLLAFNQTSFAVKWNGLAQVSSSAKTEQHVAIKEADIAIVDETKRASQDAQYIVGQNINAEWHGSWWPAVIAETKDSKYFIHYVGYGCNWDEWLGPERMHATAEQVAAEPIRFPTNKELHEYYSQK
jgi:hypothetical protein